jgi:hypothetical protein
VKQRVYLETTIASYLAAKPSRDLIVLAHQQLTLESWDSRRDYFDLFVSQLVVQEAGAGDAEAAQRRMQIIEPLPLLALNETGLQLARALVDTGVVPAKAVEDALHIAVATVHGMDYLLTWNCKHIANAETRSRISATCYAHGFESPIICTPEELLGD